ncbi:MAG: SDR family NAD(P)-dependent oxidoreductase [Sulfitobacter sp.]
MSPKTYLITGAAKGIGKAVALRLAAERANLLCMDIDRKAGQALAEQISADGSRVESFVGSVADQSACEGAVKAAVDHFGSLHGLSHNAGIQRYGSVETTTPEAWSEVMATNLTSAYYLTHAALPELRKTHGAIVLMASVQSFASQANVAAYTAAKHGLVGLTKSIAVDFAAQGVRCNAVAPGSVDTPMLHNAVALADDPDAVWEAIRNMHPLGRSADPMEVANVVAFLLSDEASFVTGETVRVDGGLLSAIAGSPKEKET